MPATPYRSLIDAPSLPCRLERLSSLLELINALELARVYPGDRRAKVIAAFCTYINEPEIDALVQDALKGEG